MVTNTTNFRFNLPGVALATDSDQWGFELNTNWTNLDTTLLNIARCNIASSAPATPLLASGALWLNNTSGAGGTWPLQIYDGTSWVTIGSLNTSNHTFAQSGTVINYSVITANSVYTPTVGMTYCLVEVVGGGGGGGNVQSLGGTPDTCGAGGGGGGGAYAKKKFTSAQIGASQTITIGAGGAPNTAGGTTFFGALLVCGGGGAGANGTSSGGSDYNFKAVAGGTAGAVVTPGDLNIPGSAGAVGLSFATNPNWMVAPGAGGGTAISPPIQGGTTNTNPSSVVGTAGQFGSGGSGGAVFRQAGGNAAGGDGGGGVVIITEFI